MTCALVDDVQDRSAWRTLCHEAVTQFEDSRVEALAHKRAVRKGAQPRSNLSAWPCDSCPRVCSSRIGLHAHQQTHRWHAILRFFSTVQSVLSVRTSVTLVNCDHIGWNSSKIISPLVSLGCSLSATPTWRVCSKGNTPKFGPKMTHPLLIWASETFDHKLQPNGYR